MSERKTVEDRVAQYLEESGFPLEMRVAGFFRRVMYSVQREGSVEQRVIYTGQDGNGGWVLREIDVTAMAIRPLHVGFLHFSVKLVIECKSFES